MSGQGEATQILDLSDARTMGGPVAPVDTGMSSNATVPSLHVATSHSLAVGATLHPSTPNFGGVAPETTTHYMQHVGDDKGKQKRILIAIAGLITVGLVALISLSDESSLDSLLAVLGLASTEEHLAPLPKRNKAPTSKTPEPIAVKALASNPVSSSQTISSPGLWGRLKNELREEQKDPGAPLTTDQEETFKSALAHEFTYQRYKAVMDLAALKAEGSEMLLRSALDSPKLWTRMRALMALAELGDDITAEDIQKGLGSAHGELRARFFKRFERSPCGAGCYFIARASLPHLDATGREAVIRVIAKEDDVIRDRFMVAATFDPSDRVRATAQKWLDSHAVTPDVLAEVRAIVAP